MATMRREQVVLLWDSPNENELITICNKFIRLLPKLHFLISEELHFQSFASSEIAFFAISEELYFNFGAAFPHTVLHFIVKRFRKRSRLSRQKRQKCLVAAS